MLLAGQTQKTVAKRLSVSRQTVNRWWQKSKNEATMADRKRSGRPKKLTRVAKIVLAKSLTKKKQTTRKLATRSHSFVKMHFLVLKIKNLVLETLRVSLFDLNHVAALSSSILVRFIRFERLEEDFKKPVSSAKRLVKRSVAFGRSIIYMRNRRGPRTLPCGTPHVMWHF